MIRQAVALAASLGTLIAMWMAGSGDWKGWAVALGNEVVWLVFIVVFAAWGLLPLAAVLIVIYARNLTRWREQSR